MFLKYWYSIGSILDDWNVGTILDSDITNMGLLLGKPIYSKILLDDIYFFKM